MKRFFSITLPEDLARAVLERKDQTGASYTHIIAEAVRLVYGKRKRSK